MMFRLMAGLTLIFASLPANAEDMPQQQSEQSAIQETAAPEVTAQLTNDSLESQMANANIDLINELQNQEFNFNEKDSIGNTPLYYLLSRNPDLNVAQKAIQYGADVNAPAANGMIPLNIATSKANELQLQILMMQTMGLDTSNPQVQEELKKNLFHSMNHVIKMAEMLIANGADVNRQSVLGTPLMNAVTNEWNLEIVNLLIKAGANLNQTDKDGKTALFYAEASGCDNIVTALIKAGADTGIKDNSGKTYLEMKRVNIKSGL